MKFLDDLNIAYTVLDGPWDTGIEQRWMLRLEDGRQAMVGQLAPDLARDASIRHRYQRDIQRFAELPAMSLAPTIARGPSQDNADTPPWRLRLHPAGTLLVDLLKRAPLPLDELAVVFSGVADAIYAVHTAGAVLRDLQPEHVIRTSDHRTVLIDVGLARTDTLSSHTASSFFMQASAYAAPEQLSHTTVDQRSDIYSLGVMLYQALIGEPPFQDVHVLTGARPELPPLAHLRPETPPVLDDLIRRCLSTDPDQRPSSITDIAWVLRGGTGIAIDRTTTTCQHCGTRLRLGQRLCVTCGRVATRFEHVSPREAGWGVELVSVSEDADRLAWLTEFLASVSQPHSTVPRFIVGAAHLYSEEERRGAIHLPTRLFSDLQEDSAHAIVQLIQEQGLVARVISPHESSKIGSLVGLSLTGTATLSVIAALTGIAMWPFAAVGGLISFAFLARLSNTLTNRGSVGQFRLRNASAALPASDPLVARLTALLQRDPPPDIRLVVSELALLIQRLVDHRARLINERAEVDMLVAPLAPLVTALEQHVERLITMSDELNTLNEATMVRAFAASQARGEPNERQQALLDGLDRLRVLEDERAAVFHRLLEVQSLLERNVELGLAVHDPQAEHERQLQLALTTLSSS